jgi:hypothetical protein
LSTGDGDVEARSKTVSANRWIADFDSSTAMLRAVASSLRDRDLPLLGMHGAATERVLGPLSRLVDRLPERLRKDLFVRAGTLDAVRERALGSFDAEAVARWTTGMVPQRHVPAVAIGASNGALTHLWAALGVPWLPQTVLVPVRRDAGDVDDVRADFEWGRRAARPLLARNPQLVLHQMIDPVQDRRMVHRMAYFRLKRLALGEVHERFLRERLAPGGTIWIVDCTLDWGVTRSGDRHVFQHGAPGGLTEDEYRHGGPRVTDYLHDQRATRFAWDPPPLEARAPEAEWGYDDRLGEDLVRVAARRGWRVRRMRFGHPEDTSPLVADLFAWWNARRGVEGRRLLVSSFILLDPTLTLRAGAIPFWMAFNTEGSASALERYLAERPPFDAIDMTLFSHGVDSIGLVPLARWADLRGRARRGGRLFGVDPRAFPKDFGNFMRYHRDLVTGLPASGPPPSPMRLEELDDFLGAQGERYAVQIASGTPS